MHCSHMCMFSIPAKSPYLSELWNQSQTPFYIYISLLCPCCVSCIYQLSLFFLIVRNRKQYSCALVYTCQPMSLQQLQLRVYTQLSSLRQVTSLLQLHVEIQIPGFLVAGWNNLPGVTYSGQTGETPLGGSGDHLALRALAPWSRRGSTVCPCHVLPSVGCSEARPCLGNKMLSFTVYTVCTCIQYKLYRCDCTAV